MSDRSVICHSVTKYKGIQGTYHVQAIVAIGKSARKVPYGPINLQKLVKPELYAA
jgi:hypothetical protein